MAKVTESFRHNLVRLADFSGRESRGLFWPYAIALFLGLMALSYIALIPALFDMLQRTARFVEENPGRPIVEPGPVDVTIQPLPPELMPDMTGFLRFSIAINLLFALLIAAAAVRRLHDRDRRGMWALLPLPFWTFAWLFTWWLGPDYMFRAEPDLWKVQVLMLDNLFAWASLIWLVVLLAGEGTAGPNRYGTEFDSGNGRQG